MKYRIIQPFLLLLTLLGVIIYCIAVLILWPIFLIGSWFWSFETLHDMLCFYLDLIPEIPEN